LSNAEHNNGRARQIIGLVLAIACVAGAGWYAFRGQAETVSAKDALAAEHQAKLVEQSLRENPPAPVVEIPGPPKSGRGAVAVPGR
jgi:hypothetical protein